MHDEEELDALAGLVQGEFSGRFDSMDESLRRIAAKQAELQDQLIVAWMLANPGKEPVLCSKQEGFTHRFWIEERKADDDHA